MEDQGGQSEHGVSQGDGTEKPTTCTSPRPAPISSPGSLDTDVIPSSDVQASQSEPNSPHPPAIGLPITSADETTVQRISADVRSQAEETTVQTISADVRSQAEETTVQRISADVRSQAEETTVQTISADEPSQAEETTVQTISADVRSQVDYPPLDVSATTKSPIVDSSTIPPTKPSPPPSKIPTPATGKTQVADPRGSDIAQPANQPSMTPQQLRALQDVQSQAPSSSQTAQTVPTEMGLPQPPGQVSVASPTPETAQNTVTPTQEASTSLIPTLENLPADKPTPPNQDVRQGIPRSKQTTQDVTKPGEAPQETPKPQTQQGAPKPKKAIPDEPNPQLSTQEPSKPKHAIQDPPKPTETRLETTRPKPVAPKEDTTSHSPPDTAASQSGRSGGSSVPSPQRELTLYFNYASYYSQKVLLAFYEKGLTFKPQPVNLVNNEHLKPRFISMNPKAEVPVLKVGDKYITESEVIINYIGRLPISAGNSLVGDSRTASGQTIQRFRRLLDGLNVPLITCGIVYHPQLSKGGVSIPSYQQEMLKERVSGKLNTLSVLSETYPEHRDAYLELSETHAQKYEAVVDEEAVKRELDQLGRVLVAVEEQLTKSKESEAHSGEDRWLCGEDFTAADITLLVLLTRLHLLGLHTNYLQDELSAVRAYYGRATQRASYQRLLKDSPGAKEAVVPYLLYNSRRALPYVGGLTAVGAIAGVAYWVYKKAT